MWLFICTFIRGASKQAQISAALQTGKVSVIATCFGRTFCITFEVMLVL